MLLTRRTALTGLVAAALPRVAHADDSLLDAARKEGTVTWYIAQIDTESAEDMGRRFTAAYPGVKVSVIRTTGQVAYQRLQLEMKNKSPECDVFSTTDISQMPVLKEKDALLRYEPPNAAGLLPAYRELSDPGFYDVTSATNHFIGYNSSKVTAADAPKSWTDLQNPKWKGQVALPHPGFSGCAGVWAAGIRKKYRWDYFEKLAANKPRVGRSFNDPVTLITAGECVVGAVPANAIFPAIERGNPLGIAYPTDGCSVCTAPSAIPATAPHPNAAKLFLDWLLGVEYTKASVQRGSEPIRGDVPAKVGRVAASDLPLMHLTVAEIRKDVPEVIEQWRDTFG
jgi:iron(III) transport system substrate-binding protein